MFHQYTNIYTKIITLMKVCQSWVFTPPNSPFFVRIFFIFEENPVGNLIFSITSLTSLIFYFMSNHWRVLIFLESPSLFQRITLCNAWLASLMSLQILTIFSLSLLPSIIHHKVFVTFFLMCIVSNKWTIFICFWRGTHLWL